MTKFGPNFEDMYRGMSLNAKRPVGAAVVAEQVILVLTLTL
jgi:hypothetical protein